MVPKNENKEPCIFSETVPRVIKSSNVRWVGHVARTVKREVHPGKPERKAPLRRAGRRVWIILK